MVEVEGNHQMEVYLFEHLADHAAKLYTTFHEGWAALVRDKSEAPS